MLVQRSSAPASISRPAPAHRGLGSLHVLQELGDFTFNGQAPPLSDLSPLCSNRKSEHDEKYAESKQ